MVYLLLIIIAGLLFLIVYVKNFNTPIDKKKESLVALAKGLSYANQSAIDDVKLYTENLKQYFKKYEDDLLQRGIESENEITDVVALVNALMKVEKLAYIDWKAPATEALIAIDKLTDGELSKKACYKDLENKFGSHSAATALFEDKDDENIYFCTKTVRYQLLIIDEDSDAYPCVLVETQNIYYALSTAKGAGIKVRYEGEIVT